MPFLVKKLMAAISNPVPVIDSFSGDTSTFTWSTTNASSVVINNGIGAVASSGSTSNTYIRTTNHPHNVTFTLTASDGVANVTQQVTVYYPSNLPSYCSFFTWHPNCQ